MVLEGLESRLVPYYDQKLIESDAIELYKTEGGKKTRKACVSDCVETAVRHFANIVINNIERNEGGENPKLVPQVTDFFKEYAIEEYANSTGDALKTKWLELLGDQEKVIYSTKVEGSETETLEAKAGWVNYIILLSSIFTLSPEHKESLEQLRALVPTSAEPISGDAAKVVQTKICDLLKVISAYGTRTDVGFEFSWINKGGEQAVHIRDMGNNVYDMLGYVKIVVKSETDGRSAEFCIGMENGHGFMDWLKYRENLQI